jgi:hypothetical protein
MEKAPLWRVAREFSVCGRELRSALLRHVLTCLSRERKNRGVAVCRDLCAKFEGRSGERQEQNLVKATRVPLRLYIWLLHVATLSACLHHLPPSGKTRRKESAQTIRAVHKTQRSTAPSHANDKLLALHPTTLHVLLALPRPLH